MSNAPITAEKVLPPALPSSGYSRVYKHYVLIIMMLVYACSALDRQILSVLLEPIKQDLGLSDTQLGLLSGMGFALFYATMGVPIARWADRHSRVNLISIAIVLWSGMTALSGAASNFLQLGLARVGVGVGEAGCTPPAHSLIADYFESGERVRAMAIYSLGLSIGVALGYLLGGWINEIYGWRMAFICVGLPGLVLAVVVRFTVREPTRGQSDGVEVTDELQPLTEVFRFLWNERSFRHLSIATGLLAFAAYGGATWFPAFLIRSHGMSTGEIGSWLAPISMAGGATGTLLGGYLATKLGKSNSGWYAWLPAVATLLSIPFSVLALLASSSLWVMVLIIPSAVAPAVHAAPVYSTVQGLVEPRMRATATAVLLLITNLIGLGLGPLCIGIVSDLLVPHFAEESLRISLLLGLGISVWSAWHFFLAGRALNAKKSTPQYSSTTTDCAGDQ